MNFDEIIIQIKLVFWTSLVCTKQQSASIIFGSTISKQDEYCDRLPLKVNSGQNVSTWVNNDIFNFRIYLTDATPDNFVVDRTAFRISFVDLDSLLIVNSNLIRSNEINRHQRIDCEQCFAFVPEILCKFQISDINLFSACQVGDDTNAIEMCLPLLIFSDFSRSLCRHF